MEDEPREEIIKWEELYETMEAVTDRCEDVLNGIEGHHRVHRVAPVLGMALSFALMVATFRSARPSRVDALFQKLQLVSAAFSSLDHGTNDAQKTMGIIAILLFSAGCLGSEFYVPL
jgi:Phosphate transporter family